MTPLNPQPIGAPQQAVPQLPPQDPGNPHISPGECSLSIANVKLSAPGADGGDRVLLTVRTTSATISVFLDRDSAERWADMIGNASRMCSTILVPKPTIGPIAR